MHARAEAARGAPATPGPSQDARPEGPPARPAIRASFQAP
jgi:hypothetical protein